MTFKYEYERMGPIGPGTPHARMEATWELMERDQDEVVRLTDYHPLRSGTTLEVAYTIAFGAIREERDRYRDALKKVAASMCSIDAALDPGRAIRVAREALRDA